MKGVTFEKAGASAQVVDDLEVPEPSADQILVKSIYAAINPVYVRHQVELFRELKGLSFP